MPSRQQNGRLVNGDVNGVKHSAFLEHLLKYPVISDGVSTVKQNKYGQQGITLSTNAYNTFAAPMLQYLAKPYEYVAVYVKKADEVGDKTLTHIDARFPVVKKPTDELYAETKGLVLMPYHKGIEGRDHVMTVFSGERKNLGDGVVPMTKAAVTTALIVTSETLAWVRDVISAGKQTVQEKVNEKANTTN